MQTEIKKSEVANVAATNKAVTTNKKDSANDEKNLQKLFEKIKTPTISNRAESIYKSADHLKDFDGGKKFRNAMRKKLEKFSIAFVQAAQANNKEKMQSAFNSFQTFYKETYSKNDFSVSSVYSGTNENKLKYYETFFAGCKVFIK
jgi:hypothetical protein